MSRRASHRFYRRRKPPAGSRPGALAIAPDAPRPRITVIDYDEAAVREQDVEDVEALAAYVRSDTVTWIDIQGFGDEALLNRIGEIFGIHRLAMADIVNVPQRPKSESYGRNHLLVSHMATPMADGSHDTEQVSVIMGQGYVLTFQERPGDIFEPVRRRIREGRGAIRRMRADYLAYAVLDRLVDGYFPWLDNVGERLQELEDEILQEPGPDSQVRLHGLRRELTRLRRLAWSQRDAVSGLMRPEDSPFGDDVRVYLRDVYDHAVQILDMVESQRDIAMGLMDIYLSTISNRMNEIMKVLTIMASLFVPLTFVAGVYGMNFEHMPELGYRWSYPIFWAVIVVMAGGLLWYFRRQGFIGAGGGRRRKRGGS